MEGVLKTYADIIARTREVDPETAIASENFLDRSFRMWTYPTRA